jgi:hypothetical protein
LLARAWAAGAGPGSAPFTIDRDSTICETYGLTKEGATRFTHTGVCGYHPLLAIAAATGDVVMACLRGGNANSGRGAGHFLRETIGQVRDAGASGQITSVPTRASCPRRRRGLLHDGRPLLDHRPPGPLGPPLIEMIPESSWTPIPYWLHGGTDVAEITYNPYAEEPDAAPVRLVSRRVRPTPGSQLALFALYDYPAFVTDRDGQPRPGG